MISNPPVVPLLPNITEAANTNSVKTQTKGPFYNVRYRDHRLYMDNYDEQETTSPIYIYI